MLSPHQIAHQFYNAFAKRDFTTMQSLYHPNVVFNDAAFVDLNCQQVCAMWQMLLTGSKDLALEYTLTETNDTDAFVNWTATYTFSKTGRKVVNNINAHLVCHDGLIIKHTDSFSFYKWAKQAFGPVGFLLGGTSYFQKKVQYEVQLRLQKFMAKLQQKDQ